MTADQGRRLSIPRVLLGAPSSGVGKTTVTVGLCRALTRRGLKVAVFKCGPDYLDPSYHARAAGRPSHTLDGWMMGREAVLATFTREAKGADIAIIEGVMGLFDGSSPTEEAGSSAEIAKWLQAPVALVVDASGMARSVAALAKGFATYDAEVSLRGLICNRVGSQGHLALLRQALGTLGEEGEGCPTAGGLKLLGGLPKAPDLAFSERHLGLHSADAEVLPDRILDGWADLVEAWFDVDALMTMARQAPSLEDPEAFEAPAQPLRCRLGLAMDEAFHFYYPDNLRRVERLGAELVRFSPLHDHQLPEVDGLYFGGGYPELHAEGLEANEAMRRQISAFAAEGGPLYAECGGLMYLSRCIRTLDGRAHAMVGLIPGEAVMADRLQALGYTEVETTAPSLLGPAGLRFRGHQFRYSTLQIEAVDQVYRLHRRRGEAWTEGYQVGSVLASYVHAHWASNPAGAAGLVERCVAHRTHLRGSHAPC